MQDRADTTPAERQWHLWVLARCRGAQVRNAVDQQLRDAPVRVAVILMLLIVIWAALYWILKEVLRQIGRYELVAVVANQQIFIHFFLVLGVMLAFSNAVLAFGSLFGPREPGHLLALPVPPRDVVCLKWLEGMALSSWSFLLLGVPLMLAVARNTDVAWYYYPLFIGHFLGFVIIPGTFGLLVAWAVAMWAPRRPLAVAVWCGVLVVTAAGLWFWSILRNAEVSDAWLQTFYRQVTAANRPWLPSTWTAKGIMAAMGQRVTSSLVYLAAILSNGALFAWVTVNVVGRTWARAYSRASQGRARSMIHTGWFTSALCLVLFFYLPRRLRMIMLKDLRGFARDAAQWTQMVIMLGLLLLYAANLRRMPLDLSSAGMRGLLAFLNLTTVSLILATFTSRFVFPLLSLESQQMWLLGLLPVRRTTLLLAKFIFALTVTGLSALLVIGLSVRALELPAEWARVQLAVCLGICVGLSGLSVGLGARFPLLGQRNPARIASGFGGTFNLIASMLFVAAEMAGLAYAGVTAVDWGLPGAEGVFASHWLALGLFLLGVVVAGVSLWVGARHFERLEC
jgi:ABC-2 type transport system permease protein